MITFVGKTPKELQKAFQESVNDYLDWCRRARQRAKQTFLRHVPESADYARTSSAIEQRLAEACYGKSLNGLAVERLCN